MTDAIVSGGLRGSMVLAERMRELEAERGELARAQKPSNVVRLLPRLPERYRALVRDLPGLLRNDGNGLVAEFAITGHQIALTTGTFIGHAETGGAGGGT